METIIGRDILNNSFPTGMVPILFSVIDVFVLS